MKGQVLLSNEEEGVGRETNYEGQRAAPVMIVYTK